VSRRAFAPAKVNLFLHVGRRRPDGYHPIASLMAFADVADVLEIRDGEGETDVVGPFATHAPAGPDNLVTKAAHALNHARAGFRLDKQIPAGAGLGGGSADAAAALRLLGAERPAVELLEMAAYLGSDVPACFGSRPVLAQGRGERLTPWPWLRDLPAVLVWPGVAVSTAAVYVAFDASAAGADADAPEPHALASTEDAAEFLRACRNDLEACAIALQPVIGEALAALSSQPESLLARMSGSGSAVFALCRTTDDAQALAARVAGRYPEWWVRAATLGAPPLWGNDR
jgi:4-diphosphocytidyl-2-C-methyl-D-erythritol kinase